MATQDYARWFRGSTPYISTHRDKTFVVLLPGEAVAHANLTNIIHDLALLHVLGVRLVLIHGARPQIEHALSTQDEDAKQYHNDRRITNDHAMQTIAGVYGQIRTRLEALFSTGLPNTPLHNVDVPVIAGNFVTAQPIGVVDGVDHLLTGVVRRIEYSRIHKTLQKGGVIVQSPLGYSPSGQVFNLTAEELAADMAVQIGADKLIVFDDLEHLSDASDKRISSVTPTELETFIEQLQGTHHHARLVSMAKVVRAGVAKAQLVSYEQDGALLAELFTAQGCGTQVLEQPRRGVRRATLADVAGIVEVIRPLEESGVLVRRDRDRLEQEVEQFLVADIDGIVVGCCAVYGYGDCAELACVAVHENYRNQDDESLGQSLLSAAKVRAFEDGATMLFVLTTQTRDWFLEHGFDDADVNVLPEEKQSLYNWQRSAKILTTSLN